MLVEELEKSYFEDKNIELKVNRVREYIKNINGFKKITIFERKENWGLANSIINGVTKIVIMQSLIFSGMNQFIFGTKKQILEI